MHDTVNASVKRNPVLLIHGIDDTATVFRKLSAYLTRLGWPVYSLDLFPSNGDLGLNRLAKQVANYVEKTFPREQSFDLVGFSMGGIISRYYVQRLRGIDRVQRLITISSPHKGSWMGYARQNPGCIQMRPNSRFLKDLNRDAAMLERLNFTSIWTPLDLMILPAESSQLHVGKEATTRVPLHPWMLTDVKSMNLVVDALREPLRNNMKSLKECVRGCDA